MAEQPSIEIRRAGPQARRKATVWLLFLAIAAFGTVLLAQWFLDRSATRANRHPRAAVEELRAKLIPLLFALGLVGVVLAGWLGRLSWRVAREQCFPPEGVVVVKDTKVVRGRRARRIALLGMAITVVLLLCSIALPLLTWRILNAIVPGG